MKTPSSRSSGSTISAQPGRPGVAPLPRRRRAASQASSASAAAHLPHQLADRRQAAPQVAGVHAKSSRLVPFASAATAAAHHQLEHHGARGGWRKLIGQASSAPELGQTVEPARAVSHEPL